jgi:hypothetical protein
VDRLGLDLELWLASEVRSVDRKVDNVLTISPYSSLIASHRIVP